MYAYGRKNRHGAKTLALSTIFGTIAIVVAVASVLTSGIYEKQMRMLMPTQTPEIFEIDIYNELKSLTNAVQKLEKRLESLSHLTQKTVDVEIEKPQELTGELSSSDRKINDIILQKPSKGSLVSKASRTHGSRALHRKPHHKLHRKA